MVEAAVQELMKYGLPGVIIILLGFWVYRKDTELTQERAARIEDAKLATEKILILQKELLDAVRRISDLSEKITPQNLQGLMEKILTAQETITSAIRDKLERRRP